jgi:uncharacterized protein
VYLPDNNILINAFRADTQYHLAAKTWLEATLNGGQSVRLFPTVEAGFLRIVTHPRLFTPPSPMEEAASFFAALCNTPNVEICPWTQEDREAWLKLCTDTQLVGKDCNDAMLAVLAIGRGLCLVTFDKGFSRFKGLDCLILS